MTDGALDVVNVLMGGEAGQGLATVGEILAKALVRSGYRILVTQAYESRIRGGHNTFAVRAGVEEVRAPGETFDVLVALDDATLSLHREELAPGALVIADGASPSAAGGDVKVPFKDLAAGKYANTAALGVAAAALGLDREVVQGALEDRFGRKDAETTAANAEALVRSYAWFASSGAAARPLARVVPRSETGAPRRLMLDGNQAIAFGAVSAGARFCSFYPMTPSTSIALTLAAHAAELGLVVEQAEDEIAAVNMAIGASFAGAPAMVATSGGGFALMVEGVSLAAMTETPLVIVVGQRPGPATGLPTRTEQADLEFVLHAGHGEFPRAVLAPGTVEQCFHLTRRAFELAGRAQGPVFLLTDQFLADSYRAVEPFDVEALDAPGAPDEAAAVQAPYGRYRLTHDGVSPRLLPCRTEHLVVADSDEHDELGHITEDLAFRKSIVEKRLRKGDTLKERALGPDFVGEDRPEVLLVSWGSTRGSCLDAAEVVRSRDASAAVLHFPQVWPLSPDGWIEHLDGAREVVSVEGNATAQFARLVRRETGFDVSKRVLRYDGLPITPEYVVRGLESLGVL